MATNTAINEKLSYIKDCISSAINAGVPGTEMKAMAQFITSGCEYNLTAMAKKRMRFEGVDLSDSGNFVAYVAVFQFAGDIGQHDIFTGNIRNFTLPQGVECDTLQVLAQSVEDNNSKAA